MKRSAVVGASLVVTSLLAACGSQSPDPGGEQTPHTAQAPSGPQITDPRDAAALAPCDLLPAEAATSLGFDPEGQDESDPTRRACAWRSQDGRDSLGLRTLPDRSLSSYLDNTTQYTDFQELTIAGHPAVRANRNDPGELGDCDIFLATKDDQVLASMASRHDPDNDPCGLARHALEIVVPHLPTAG
ncbi:DUF3558 family protein [Saccharopolyspora hordei]|uniref:DUF3558 domain-containing protein n=1 Tax=Saccharopolyspora hordei TaxID=1838 RepID=A0A853AQW4_9PSEU|nr:hypothetical protein [Saccharopolyspora hordei]